MTTENETTRDLNELLSLETYQGMTDAEIEQIIQYKIDVEVRKRFLEADNARLDILMEERIAAARESSKHAQDMLDSLVNKALGRD